MDSALRYFLSSVTKALRYIRGYVVGPVFFRISCSQVGEGTSAIGKAPRIRNSGRIELGRRFRSNGTTRRTEITVGRAGVLTIGDDSTLNQGVQIYCVERISIGDRVAIASGVHIYDTNSHPVKPMGTTRVEPVTIEDDVWIGMNAMLLPGTRVGRGSVIGAGAIVHGAVPPGSIVVPAQSKCVSQFEVPDRYSRRDNGPSLVERLRGVRSVLPPGAVR